MKGISPPPAVHPPSEILPYYVKTAEQAWQERLCAAQNKFIDLPRPKHAKRYHLSAFNYNFKNQLMKILREFREFALKGNMFDMAVGIIIGASFNKIVSSLVADVFMPPLGYIIGGVNFRELAYELQPSLMDDSGTLIQEAVYIRYGEFIQTSIDFIIIAITVFVVIKVINTLKRKSEDEADETVETPKNIQLLAEIRDLLKREGR